MAADQTIPEFDAQAAEDLVPPLEGGDRLTRAEFERRYNAMPDVKKAALIEGVVYMPSPVRPKRHAGPHPDVIGRLSIYKADAPGGPRSGFPHFAHC